MSLQCLLEENEVLKHEIQRLKRDNAELILIAKTSAADRDMVLVSIQRQTMTEATVLSPYQTCCCLQECCMCTLFADHYFGIAIHVFMFSVQKAYQLLEYDFFLQEE